MFLRAINFLLVALLIGLSQATLAMTPEEYCDVHEDSGAPGECVAGEPTGECLTIYTNLGTEEVKKCVDGGCELVDASECE